MKLLLAELLVERENPCGEAQLLAKTSWWKVACASPWLPDLAARLLAPRVIVASTAGSSFSAATMGNVSTSRCGWRTCSDHPTWTEMPPQRAVLSRHIGWRGGWLWISSHLWWKRRRLERLTCPEVLSLLNQGSIMQPFCLAQCCFSFSHYLFKVKHPEEVCTFCEARYVWILWIKRHKADMLHVTGF